MDVKLSTFLYREVKTKNVLYLRGLENTKNVCLFLNGKNMYRDLKIQIACLWCLEDVKPVCEGGSIMPKMY